LAGGNVNFFKGDRRISIVGLFNNVNQQNFSSQDLLGFSNSSRGGRGGASVPSVGAQAGINTTNAFGINYSDTWGKKLEVQGSYFFNNGDNRNSQLSNTQYLLAKDSSQFEVKQLHQIQKIIITVLIFVLIIKLICQFANGNSCTKFSEKSIFYRK